MKLKFKKFGEINFEKNKKFYHDFTKTFGELNFGKMKKKFYRDFAKTLLFIILHAEEAQHKILTSWSMKIQICRDVGKDEGSFEERNSSNNSYLGVS